MSQTVDIEDANTQFLSLIARVEEGQEITLTRDGIPAARIVPIRNPTVGVIELIKRERPGGQLVSADDIRAAKEEGRA